MRQKKEYRLWKRGKYFYYRLPGMQEWASTSATTRTAAERFAINKLRKGRSDTNFTFKQYAEPFFK